MPQVVDAVPETPVIAAGGIADGRGVAAAGALLGTRFLASEEATVHRLYRQRVLDAAATDAVRSETFDDG